VNSGVKTGLERHQESNRRTITVDSHRVDDLLLQVPESFSSTISLLWIDVQGYESFVFEGARNLLSKGVSVVSEIWPYGMSRAGVGKEKYCSVAKDLWSSYWVFRRGRFVKYPIATLDLFYDELGPDGESDNVVFTS
jgi:hypothetical protein